MGSGPQMAWTPRPGSCLCLLPVPFRSLALEPSLTLRLCTQPLVWGCPWDPHLNVTISCGSALGAWGRLRGEAA